MQRKKKSTLLIVLRNAAVLSTNIWTGVPDKVKHPDHRLLDKSGVTPQTSNVSSRTELMQCHGFRKFFETTAKLAGVDMLYLKRLMGHSTGLEDSYFKPTGDQIQEGNNKIGGYIAVIADLTIYPTDEENARLRHELEKTKVHHTEEWEMLRKQVTELRRKMGFL
jgi:hypothetical protein